MAPLKPPQNLKFCFFFSASAIPNSTTNHTPNESPNISTSLTPSSLSPTFVVIVKGKSLLVSKSTPTYESIDCMSNPGNSEQKKKMPKKSEWEINRVFQD